MIEKFKFPINEENSWSSEISKNCIMDLFAYYEKPQKNIIIFLLEVSCTLLEAKMYVEKTVINLRIIFSVNGQFSWSNDLHVIVYLINRSGSCDYNHFFVQIHHEQWINTMCWCDNDLLWDDYATAKMCVVVLLVEGCLNWHLPRKLALGCSSPSQ